MRPTLPEKHKDMAIQQGVSQSYYRERQTILVCCAVLFHDDLLEVTNELGSIAPMKTRFFSSRFGVEDLVQWVVLCSAGEGGALRHRLSRLNSSVSICEPI